MTAPARAVPPTPAHDAPAAVPAAASRRHDLDWLRAFAILALLFFHSAMPFAADSGWHIKNAEQSNLLLEFNFFLSRFRMALLFVIAGVATQFVLRRRTPGGFLRDRALRLLVPVAFGILVIVPPQVYYERLASGAFSGGFLAFWPRTLDFRPYPAGDTSYHHLWFIFYLFLYSALLLPAIAWTRTGRGAAALEALRAWLARRGVHWLAIPVVTAFALLVDRFSGTQNVVDDGAMFLVYFSYFVAGFVLADDERLWRRIEAGRHASFTVAVLAILLVNHVRWNALRPETDAGLVRQAWLALLAINGWAWVLTILGYGRRWLDRDHAILRWSRDASYPFYILHQTVIVAIAYHVVRTDESILAKYLFTSVVSLGVTLALYETLVRPYRPVRWLFGMPTAAPRESSTR